MPETNLMARYPRSKRNVEARGQDKTPEQQAIARRFDKDFFDGSREVGYGGYTYNARFFGPVVAHMREHYGLADDAKILDVGAGKGFMLHDFKELMPNATVAGLDISEYAVEHSMPSVRPFMQVGNAKALPYPDNSFDLVVSINTVHNLELEDCKQALREIERVSRGNSFIMVDAWRNDEERRLMHAWNLTALTYMHTDDWKKLFAEIGYTGDYWWFNPMIGSE